MPGAPASTQTRTASSTDGTAPPREFRTVAILFTLTDSFANPRFPSRQAPAGSPNGVGSHTTRHLVNIGSWPLEVYTAAPTCCFTASMISCPHRRISASSFPSSMTRSSGSVPE
jgi:hypothetical protein